MSEKDPVLAAMEEAMDLPSTDSDDEIPPETAKSEQGEAVLADSEAGSEVAAPEEASEPDPLAEWKAKLDEADRAKRGVLSELQEERKARRGSEEQYQQLVDALNKQREAEEAAKKRAEIEASTPPADEDPVGHLRATVSRELSEKIGTLEEKLGQITGFVDERREQENFLRVAHHNAMLEEAFRKEKPDYDEALNFLREKGAQLLRQAVPGITEEEIRQRAGHADYQLVMTSLQAGKNPAQLAYEYAQQWGYQPGGEAGTPAGSHTPAPAGSTPAPATKAHAKPKVPSLSSTGGVAGSGRRKVTRDEYIKLDMNDPTYTMIAGDPRLNREMGLRGEVWV